MNKDDYYTHVPLNVVGSLKAITPERLAHLLKAEADLAAARARIVELTTERNTAMEMVNVQDNKIDALQAELAAARALLSMRGYAHLGIGAYIINHSAAGEPAEIVITAASDEDKATRIIGDDVDNPPDSPPIQPDEMIVRLRFENVVGLDTLEKQLAWVRKVHFRDDGDITGKHGLLPESGWDGAIDAALAAAPGSET